MGHRCNQSGRFGGGGGGGRGGHQRSPVENNSVHVWGVGTGFGDLAGFNFMDHSPQFIDTDQDLVSNGHPDVVSRGLATKEGSQRDQNKIKEWKNEKIKPLFIYLKTRSRSCCPYRKQRYSHPCVCPGVSYAWTRPQKDGDWGADPRR